jgi:CBS domain-containing protein
MKVAAMDARVRESTIYHHPHGFVDKRGEPILIARLDEKRCRRLIDMYLAFRPRSSFQGLPPLTDSACVKWVEHMIGHGINLVALSFEEGVIGHVALFPINDLKCELLVVVSPPFQSIGIGTELSRCAIQLSCEIGFERIQLSVEATNVRARHVYKKCGFEYLTYGHRGEMDMAIDLKRYRDLVSVPVDKIMNRHVIAISGNESCRAALEILLSKRIGSLPVTTENGKLVGIISKSDLIVPSQIAKNVSDILTREVLTVRQGSCISQVIQMFQSRRIRCIPVVDAEMTLVGIVGREDVLNYYVGRL